MRITDDLFYRGKKNRSTKDKVHVNLETLKIAFSHRTQKVFHNLENDILPSDLAPVIKELNDDVAKIIDKKEEKLEKLLRRI